MTIKFLFLCLAVNVFLCLLKDAAGSRYLHEIVRPHCVIVLISVELNQQFHTGIWENNTYIDLNGNISAVAKVPKRILEEKKCFRNIPWFTTGAN